ncbi:hypothetical protein [Pseudoalteromonas sp. NC201]|nr:hypothetical protein [Pseudoalteromonas sp. NC201]AUJ71761.1 hypothetical protein PNC201_17720 [Pseudoalteromonas sp. NC201]
MYKLNANEVGQVNGGAVPLAVMAGSYVISKAKFAYAVYRLAIAID